MCFEHGGYEKLRTRIGLQLLGLRTAEGEPLAVAGDQTRVSPRGSNNHSDLRIADSVVLFVMLR